MRNIPRRIGRTALAVFALPVATQAALWWLEPPRRWDDAAWSSAGILPAATGDPEPRIVVFAARTAGWRAIFAVHTWIVVKGADADTYTRYEVTGFGRPLRVNARPPDGFWLGARPEVVADIRGPLAGEAIPKIEAAVRAYPFTDYGTYRMWPGPNSNTFIASVLRAAPELQIAMPPVAIGKDYRADGSLFGLTESATGIEMSLYGLFGLKIGKVEGLELNVFTLVAGLDAVHPAVKLPAIGRIGVDLRSAPSAIADPARRCAPADERCRAP